MNKTTKTLTYVIGIIMTVAMVGSLILPMISSQVGVGDSYLETPQPTPFPEPTMPPPPDTAVDRLSTAVICIALACLPSARRPAGARRRIATPPTNCAQA